MGTSIAPTQPAIPANTAYVLALVGVVFQVLGLLLVGVMATYGFGMMGRYGMMWGYSQMMYGYTLGYGWTGMALVWLIIGIAVLILSFYGLRLIGSHEPSSIRSGSVLLLVMAIIAFPTMWGLLIGSALMFAAAIINLSQRP